LKKKMSVKEQFLVEPHKTLIAESESKPEEGAVP
jgi:hypothetical protein